MNEEIVLLGKSSYAIAIIVDILKLTHKVNKIKIISNIDDANNDSISHEYKIPDLLYEELTINEFMPDINERYIIASIGKARKYIFEEFNQKKSISENNFINIMHPSSIIGSCVNYGNGFHISPQSVIAPFTKIGKFVVINRNVSIGHHNTIEDFVTINPGVTIAGCCHIKSGATIGIGTTIIDKITIGNNAIVGAGSCVTKDIPDGVIAYGSPAKIIRSIN